MWLGKARCGKTRYDAARRVKAWQGKDAIIDRQGAARRDEAGHGTVRSGEARRSVARWDMARPGKARTPKEVL